MKRLEMNQMEVIEAGSWRCLAGVTGMTITGILGGAAAGSVIPLLGTTAGGVWGGIAGGLTGAATFC